MQDIPTAGLNVPWRAALTALHATLAFAPSALAYHDDGTLVETTYGPVRGTTDGEVRQFRGIPYAAPPVGDLRWRPPEEPTPWNEPLDANELSSSCPQVATPFGIASEDEDCLYLNVYAPPRSPWRRYPVMVWLHPGALTYGDGGHVDPRALVDEGVVVVTLNYRLGALGFLAHPGLTAESGFSGNYGLLDQQAALRWVRDNIAQFGGNAGNVTIFGQSAGGLSVHSHLISPAAEGLFDRAIVQSGAYTLTPPALAELEQHGAAFAAAVGCTDQDPACLRQLPVAALLAGPPQSPLGYVTNVDGTVLPETYLQAFADGHIHRVPVIEGSVHDEWRLFTAIQHDLAGMPVTAESYPADLQATLQLPDAALPIVLARYPLEAYDSPAVALSAAATDAIFACNARIARQLLSQHTTVYGYEFEDPDAPNGTLPPVSFPYGSYHGSELQYLFETRDVLPTPPLTSEQQALSQDMVRYWTRFARYGTPNAFGSPFWAPYLPILLDQIQLLTPPSPETGYNGFNADHKCDFWTELAQSGS